MYLSGEKTNGLLAVFISSGIFFIFNLFAFFMPAIAFVYNACIFFIIIARIPDNAGVMKYSLFENIAFAIFFSCFPALIFWKIITLQDFLIYNGAIIFLLTALMSNKYFEYKPETEKTTEKYLNSNS